MSGWYWVNAEQWAPQEGQAADAGAFLGGAASAAMALSERTPGPHSVKLSSLGHVCALRLDAV